MIQIPLVVGIVLLVGAAVIIWRRPSENNPLTVMFLAGVALIFLSDERIQNLKLGTGGFEVTRGQIKDAKEELALQIADLSSGVAQQRQILDQHQRLLDSLQSAPAAGQVGRTPAAAQVDGRVKEIQQKFAENSKYLILIFYRQGQRTAADALSGALIEQGYKSSAIATDLTEISVPGLSGDPKAGTIVIARARQVPSSLADEIRAKAAEIATTYSLSPPMVNNDEWPFKRGHIQVYMF